MFDSHLIPGRQKVHGKEVVFDLPQSGLQVGPNVPLESLVAIRRYLRDNGLTKVLDFGAGRLRNTRALGNDRQLEVWFSEFGVVHSHELQRGEIADGQSLAERFRNQGDKPSQYLWERLKERTQGPLTRLPPGKPPSAILLGRLIDDLNPVLWEDGDFYVGGAFAAMTLPPEVRSLASSKLPPRSTKLLRLNRYLIETAYPSMIAPSARTHVYPHELPDESEDFDAILLSYVLHTLPHHDDREAVLTACRDKLRPGGLLVVASPKYNSPIHQTLVPGDEYEDGWVRGIKRPTQTFYSEPSREQIAEWAGRCGFGPPDGDEPLLWKQSTAHVLGFVRA